MSMDDIHLGILRAQQMDREDTNYARVRAARERLDEAIRQDGPRPGAFIYGLLLGVWSTLFVGLVWFICWRYL